MRGVSSGPAETQARGWLTSTVWEIALSAFFADLGYQAVLALFPLILVLALHAPVWVYGLATGIGYGGGAVLALLGGRLGDRTGHKRVALAGNSLIPLLSFIGLATLPVEALVLFVAGWWARNFRSPSRRAMLTQVVEKPAQGRAFGFLHALDIGGGMLAAVYALVLVLVHAPLWLIVLVTIVPLVASTLVLSLAHAGARPLARTPAAAVAHAVAPVPDAASANRRLYFGVLIAAIFFGFSYYNIGFPILTIVQGTGAVAFGIGSYIVFLGISAVTGLLAGRWLQVTLPELAWLGYLAAALGSAGLAAATGLGWGVPGWYVSIAILGFALGVIETLEPSLIARLVPGPSMGSGMGGLTSARSLGLLLANVILGLLYHLTPVVAYGYAAALALVAMVVLLVASQRAVG